MTTFISDEPSQYQNSLNQIVPGLVTKVRRVFNEMVDRHAIKADLSKLTAIDLRDIGLTENDVTTLNHVPMPSDGALELSRTKNARAGNW